jgi:hypothetical protein
MKLLHPVFLYLSTVFLCLVRLLADGARRTFPRLLDGDVSRRFKFCPSAIRGRGTSVVSLSQEFSEKYIFFEDFWFFT